MSDRDSDDVAPRVPPHSIEAEQSVLGGLLLNNGALERVAGVLKAVDFYGQGHSVIFSTIEQIIGAGAPADVITVFEQLRNLGRVETCGGLAYLNALAQSVPSEANIRRYAEIVRERAVLRRLIATAGEVIADAFEPNGKDVRAVVDAAQSKMAELASVGERKAPKAIGDLMLAALDRYEAMHEGRHVSSLPTGMGQLDRLLGGGLRDGRVYVVAARPGEGKSSVTRSIGVRVARAGKPVLVLSQEMTQDEQADCVIAELGRVDSQRLQNGAFENGDWSRITEGVELARSLPLYFDEQGALTIADIRSKARGIKGLRLLVIDYLQLCSTTLRGKSTNDEIAEISRGVKALALDMRIPIILLSQLNRGPEKRADKEPQLSDLRDSGAIEQDTDVAMLIWTIEESERSRVVGFNLPKNRSGPKGRFAMRFEPAVYGWTDCEFPPRVASSTTKSRRDDFE